RARRLVRGGCLARDDQGDRSRQTAIVRHPGWESGRSPWRCRPDSVAVQREIRAQDVSHSDARCGGADPSSGGDSPCCPCGDRSSAECRGTAAACRGRPIGGVVLDEQDGPVPEARVVFSVSGPVPLRSRERPTMMGNYHSELSGADGRWTCSHVPERFGMISFTPVHPLFQEKTWLPDSPESSSYINVERITDGDFLAAHALMRLTAG